MVRDVVFYKEYNLSHLSFMVGKDMSFFTQDAMGLIKKYQPTQYHETQD